MGSGRPKVYDSTAARIAAYRRRQRLGPAREHVEKEDWPELEALFQKILTVTSVTGRVKALCRYWLTEPGREVMLKVICDYWNEAYATDALPVTAEPQKLPNPTKEG